MPDVHSQLMLKSVETLRAIASRTALAIRDGVSRMIAAMIVRPWPYAAGFLVVPDGADLPINVPAMTLSRFRLVLAVSQSDTYDKFFSGSGPTAPFGVASMPRMGQTSSFHLLIVPPEVMQQRADAWSVELAPRTPASMWTPAHSATAMTIAELHGASADDSVK